MSYLASYKECPSCGDNHKGKPFCEYENGSHCFSCGFTKTYDRSFAIRESRIIEIPALPNCCFDPNKFNINNLKWLAKYYITPELIRKHNISEAPDGALIFCTIKDGAVVHYQKRYIREKRLILSYGPKSPSLSSIGSSTVVLVEDPLSYIRTGEHCDSVCLWGTKTSYKFLEELLSYERILVWLDNDEHKEINSGQVAAKKICKMLDSVLSYKYRRRGFGNINVPVIDNIVTEMDPKCYSPSELKELLGVYDETPKTR